MKWLNIIRGCDLNISPKDDLTC